MNIPIRGMNLPRDVGQHCANFVQAARSEPVALTMFTIEPARVRGASAVV
jgi:hypothetical protein